MLPSHTPSPKPPGGRFGSSSTGILPEYLRRIVNYSQMDFEYTFWQMVYLCVNPSRVYRTTSYHKQTKNQWARDDPCFTVVLVYLISVATLAFGIALQPSGGFLTQIQLILVHLFVNFFGIGAFIATLLWYGTLFPTLWISNNYLRIHSVHSVEQKVEWLYSFDIHCNSYFPCFLFLYVLQFFLLPILTSSTSFFGLFLSNSLYLVAFSYYYYITFLGYSSLPFLHGTVYFLYPIALLGIGWLLCILLSFNLSRHILGLYF